MKKLLTLLSSILIAHASFGWVLNFSTGEFFNSDGTPVSSSLNFALVVDMRAGGNFEGFQLSAGDAFTQYAWLNEDQNFKTLVTGSLEAITIDKDYYFATSSVGGGSGWEFYTTDTNYGFAGGENVALVVWDSTDDFVVQCGENYGMISPKIVGADDISWVIPTNPQDKLNWDTISSASTFAALGMEGGYADKYFTLDKTVHADGAAVPEPSTYAAIFGALALGFALIRRRK